MIEIDIKKFIDENLDYTAYMEKPNTSNDTYFVIDKVGGGQFEHINNASVAIQTYAPSKYQAALVCEMLNEAIINDFITQPNISKVELNSSYPFPDTAEKKYRYQSLFDIYYYGGNENE